MRHTQFMFDLHMHSVISDGSKQPEELVRWAKELGITTMSLTDHDSTQGVLQAQTVGKNVGVHVIPGVELSVIHNDYKFHVLGYFVNVENSQLQKLFRQINEARREYQRSILEFVNQKLVSQNKKPVDIDLFFAGMPKDKIAMSVDTGRFLVENKVVTSVSQAFEVFFNKYKSLTKGVSIEQGIKAIQQAKGIAVLAHPGAPHASLLRQTKDLVEQRKLLNTFVDFGLQGIEVYHPDHSVQQHEFYSTLANEFELLVTGGSDYHGPDAPHLPQSLGAKQVTQEHVDSLEKNSARI